MKHKYKNKIASTSIRLSYKNAFKFGSDNSDSRKRVHNREGFRTPAAFIVIICLERKATGVNHRQTVEVASTRKTTAMSDCGPWRQSLVCTNDE